MNFSFCGVREKIPAYISRFSWEVNNNDSVSYVFGISYCDVMDVDISYCDVEISYCDVEISYCDVMDVEISYCDVEISYCDVMDVEMLSPSLIRLMFVNTWTYLQGVWKKTEFFSSPNITYHNLHF